jgi:hypothetical protein
MWAPLSDALEREIMAHPVFYDAGRNCYLNNT